MTEVDRLIESIAQRVTERVKGRLAASGARPGSVHATSSACAPAAGVGPADHARLIDHTLLKPEATRDDIMKLCDEARAHHFASVCVNSVWVPLCRDRLAGSDVLVCTVVGFPLGAMASGAKAYEARAAVQQGAREIDMVIHLGALRTRDDAAVFDDIRGVVEASAPAQVKVILETGALDTEQKIAGATVAVLAGAAFVKTSTGFGKGGATAEDVALLRRVVGPALGVKASGGVRTAQDAIQMVQAGANRIGASASVAIVTGAADPGAAKGY
jgi:deoxyribose-phosphate aldolase